MKDNDNQYPVLKATHNVQLNEVTILANNEGLEYLQDLIRKLIESQVPHKHFHLDRTGGLEGNISSIIIEKVI